MKAFAAVTLVVCAAVCGLAALPARSAGPVSRPTPTPTPVAIGYDEISRFVAAPSTPPPPGSFQADYQLALEGTSSVAAAASEQTPTPAPKRHGLGSLIGAVTNPMQGVGGQGGSGGMPGYGQGSPMMNLMRYGHVVRYTYYWVRNWEREDDPIAHTAVITKCPQHQIIRLDLTKKTYSIEDTSSTGCVGDASGDDAPTMNIPGRAMGPGTVDLTVKSTGENLGPKTLDGIATSGSRRTMDLSMTNATGSCSNGAFSMLTVAYISGIHKQRAYCPLSIAKMPTGMAGGGGSGGCKPTFHGSMSGNPMVSSDMLEMYLLTQTGMGGGRSGGTLLERGNVTWYYKPQAEALFTPPPGLHQGGLALVQSGQRRLRDDVTPDPCKELPRIERAGGS